ncbi:MAG: arylesterase [Caldilineaceae bacterium]
MPIRYILFALLTALFGLNGCGSRTQATPAPSPTPISATTASAETDADSAITIVAMGDSLTEGNGVDLEDAYPAQLERKLRDNGYDVTVINAGVGGETSSAALSRVQWVLTLQPDIVILETGPNDGLRGIDPALTEQNIDELVATFQKNDVTVVLAGMQIVENMGADYTEKFRAIYPAVAARYDVILIPFFLENVGGIPSLNQPDSIHPTAAGYAVVVETIYPYVVEALGEVRRVASCGLRVPV